MFSFFYTNISQLTRNFDGMNGDGNNKKNKEDVPFCLEGSLFQVSWCIHDVTWL